ncbi:hypothetical protein [Clostridium disporicum]|uniref:hypothetical protein n=1 Tax=Clostridium disporicum TaxID=84024 RepID=UPI0034A52E50
MSTIDDKKLRKNVNVSIQSKKYFRPINNILKEWEDNSLNLSTEVCESLLLSNKISKSPTLLKVVNVCELAEKILNLYPIDDTDKTQMIENVLSQIVQVDTSQLTDVISSLNSVNPMASTTVKKTKNEPVKKEVEFIERNEVAVTSEEVQPINNQHDTINSTINANPINNFSNEIISDNAVVTAPPKRRQLKNLVKKDEKPIVDSEFDERYNSSEYNIPDDFILNS